jgi:hypothetical protein
VAVLLLIKEPMKNLQDKMFIKDIKYRPFSTGKGPPDRTGRERGMRPVYAIKQKVSVFGHFLFGLICRCLASKGFTKWHGG